MCLLLRVHSVHGCAQAVATWQLIEQGILAPSQLVVDIFPEFGRGAGGKECVTLLHLLTFTAGLPAPPTHSSPQAYAAEFGRLATPEGRAAYFGSLQLETMPGDVYAYDRNAPWAIAEMINRATGRDYREYIRSELLEPMGLVDIYCGDGLPGMRKREGTHLFVDSVTRGKDSRPELYGVVVPALNQVAIRSLMVPGGGACASAADLALFYQPLLNDGRLWTAEQHSSTIIGPATVACATAVHTDERHYEVVSPGSPPVTLPVLRGWMVERAGDDVVHLTSPQHGMKGVTPGKVLRGCFGYSNSSLAFGHNGAGGQAAWGDPSTGISFAFLTNTFSEPRKSRVVELSTLANLCALTTEETVAAPRVGIARTPASKLRL